MAIVFLENEILYGRSFAVPSDPEFTVPIGKARICRTGADVTIVAFSLMVAKALEAADQLAADGRDRRGGGRGLIDAGDQGEGAQRGLGLKFFRVKVGASAAH